MNVDWHYSKVGQQFGPVSSEALKSLAAAGRLGPTDLVWNSTLTEWVPASRIKGLPFATTAAPSVDGAAQAAYAGATAMGAGSQMLSYESPASEPMAMTGRAIELLGDTRPWVLIMAIMMFLWVGLMFLVGVALLIMPALLGGRRGTGPTGPLILIGLLYLALGAIFAALPIYLTRYYSHIGNLKRLRRPVDLEQALDSQRVYWKYLAISSLVLIGLYVVGFVIAVIVRV